MVNCKIIVLSLYLFFAAFNTKAQTKDTLLVEERDTMVTRPGSFKMGFMLDQLYYPVIGFEGKLLDAHNLNNPFSFSVSWIQPLNDYFNLDFGIEIGYRYFIAKPEQIFDGYENLTVEYIGRHHSVNLPLGFNYTVGRKVKLGLSGYLTPKTIPFQEYTCWQTDSKGNHALAILDNAENYRLFNLEARCGTFVEIPLGKHKLRLSGIFRADLRDAYESKKNNKAYSFGCGVELIF